MAKFYSVGVGAGDGSYITLGALRALEQADIIAVPVKKYGEMVFKYGIKYDIMSPDTQREYEGNGIWHIRIAAKCTNEYGAVRNSIIDARVDFNKESVIEFNVE